jgi:PadR family transcriptional regulator
MLGEFEQLVLLAILRDEGEAFGASIQRLLEEQGGRRVSLGAVYTTLARLEQKGMVEGWTGDPTPERGGRRRRHYRLRPAGRGAGGLAGPSAVWRAVSLPDWNPMTRAPVPRLAAWVLARRLPAEQGGPGQSNAGGVRSRKRVRSEEDSASSLLTPHSLLFIPQSYRSACIGCTLDARSAGR